MTETPILAAAHEADDPLPIVRDPNSRLAQPLMTHCGSLVTMSDCGADKVVSDYNPIPVKAADKECTAPFHAVGRLPIETSYAPQHGIQVP